MTEDERDQILAEFDEHYDPLWRLTKRAGLRSQLADLMKGLVMIEAAYPPNPVLAGSPIEPGDRITIDEHGRAHAVPRRHTWGQNSTCRWCLVCGGDGERADRTCPGPRT